MLVKNDLTSLTEETNKTENIWTHGVAVLLFRKRKNDRNMISWWVALKLYVSQTALEGAHKSSHPESRSLNPHFGRHLNYAPARFCRFRGSPIGLIGIVPPTILSKRLIEWSRMMVPISLSPWISLEAVPKDFYGIPDYLGKYTSSFLFNRIQSVPKSLNKYMAHNAME